MVVPAVSDRTMPVHLGGLVTVVPKAELVPLVAPRAELSTTLARATAGR